jgi:hypothetical protein
LKLVQEKVGKTPEDIGTGNYFLDKTQIAQKIRARIEKWDCIKLKSFCTSKDIITESRGYPQNERKSLPAIQQIKD